MTKEHGSGSRSGDGPGDLRRPTRVHDLQRWKLECRRWAMLTASDGYAASIIEEAGIPALLVGDSASNTVYGNRSTVPVTVDEMIPLVRAVTRSTSRALVVADLPFGSYQASPEQAYATAVRFMKEGGAHAVKLEGGLHVAPHVRQLTRHGVPVMAHIGFTPQSVHQLGGYRVQGRGAGAAVLLDDARELQAAGAFAIVLELVAAEVAAQVTESVTVPTIGIGAGPDCDAQVLVWQDMAGLNPHTTPRFVKRYADMRSVLHDAAVAFARDVEETRFPSADHSYS